MRILYRLTRKKFIAADSVHHTQLARCLNTLDLTALGKLSYFQEGDHVTFVYNSTQFYLVNKGLQPKIHISTYLEI